MPKRTRSQLSAAAAIGLSCALFAFLLSWIHCRTGSGKAQDSRGNTPTQLYKPVDNSSSSGVSDSIILLGSERGEGRGQSAQNKSPFGSR